MEKQENKIKHLEMIENIIERMAKNSFQLKTWAVTLVTLVGALGTKEADKRFMCRLRKRADSFAERNGRGAERADTYYINSGQ